MGGIGNKAQLSPARAGAGTWPELGNNILPEGQIMKRKYILPDDF